MNGRLHRRFWLSSRSFSMVDRRRADLDSRLGHRRRWMAGSKATRQWNLVAPVAFFQNEGLGFWIFKISSLGHKNCLFQDRCSFDRWNNN
ncbi:hypothetical protein ACFX19_014918 [Malus domestica]